MNNEKTIGIVGAGITGLTAAYYLQKAGVKAILFDCEEMVGGRVQTDLFKDYRLDRGFQVFLTGYPEAKKILDYKALQLKTIAPGAILLGGKTRAVWDVFRAPQKVFETIASGVASVKDMWLLWRLRSFVKSVSVTEIFESEEFQTREYLENFGFSTKIIDQFFRPFYAGIFLEKDLKTSSRMFLFVFKMFSESDTALPANGIQEIPNQLASYLPQNALRLAESVTAVSKTSITTSKDTYSFDAVIDTRIPVSEMELDENCGTWNFYFSAKKSPFTARAIALNTTANATVNSICVLSDIAPNYAPKDHVLISVSVVLSPEILILEELTVLKLVENELRSLLPESSNWAFLKSYKIPQSLPALPILVAPDIKRVIWDTNGVLRASDYLAYGSVNAAMHIGRLAAERIVQEV